MSEQCRLVEQKLETLDPFYAEMHQPGVLRRIRPNESREAHGFCFICPRCKNDKQTKHYVICLFQNAPDKARPGGRFLAEVNAKGQLLSPKEQSLKQLSTYGTPHTLLKPQDLRCKWEGHVLEGVVHWKPTLLERLRGM